MSEQISVYTDGACSNNPGPGGWAFVIVLQDDAAGKTDELLRGSGGDLHTTNNRMELLAVIRGLEAYGSVFEQIPGATLNVYTDSQYVQQGISSWIKNWKKNGWKTSSRQPVKNQDLWQELDRFAEAYRPNWIWVKGHAGNTYNELCDKLAVAAIKK